MTIRGVQVQLESNDTNELISAVKNLVGSMSRQRSPEKDFVAEPAPTTTRRGNKTYLRWTPKDVCAIADIIIKNKDDRGEIMREVLRYMRTDGDGKGRTKVNLSGFIDRMRGYLLRNDNTLINRNIVVMLNEGGYVPQNFPAQA